MLKPRKWTLSYEMMPPRDLNNASNFWQTADELIESRPDFISITYGAGGKDRKTSLDVINKIVKDTPVIPIAHLTSVAMEKDEVEEIANAFLEAGVRMFLSLRGDEPVDQNGKTIISNIKNPIKSASELTYMLKLLDKKRQRLSSVNKFNNIYRPLVVSVAAFCDGNPKSKTTPEQEVVNLLEKQDAGADFAITQLYYDPKVYDNFMKKAAKAGVTIPIVAGVLPTANPSRMLRCEKYIGVKPPSELIKTLNDIEDDKKRYSYGMEFWEKLSKQAIESGSPGIHMFTFNHSKPPLDLAKRLQLI